MGDDERMRHEPLIMEPEGGDAACWLPALCAECGAMIEGAPGTACWRCGGTRREGD
ncbi:hypothetical protein [Microbacterium protaetiae]|uniref:hypothetical protein n=1 Tax=Microbacterium protaetiae TaxID=2509458 RepID=UPI0013EAD7AA|nr:hypothetical protein [Microbacterium protaetiae]